MKRHWLRGLLLGMSLALLLSGGVALAQGFSMTWDQECFECWPLPMGPEEQEPGAAFVLEQLVRDINLNYLYCSSLQVPGEPPFEPFCAPPAAETSRVFLVASCVDEVIYGWPGEFAGEPLFQLPFVYGTYVGTDWQEDEGGQVAAGPVEFSFTLAEDCSAYEFVPEAGTMMLLGSGLMGLAGYAGLRWRTRE